PRTLSQAVLRHAGRHRADLRAGVRQRAAAVPRPVRALPRPGAARPLRLQRGPDQPAVPPPREGRARRRRLLIARGRARGRRANALLWFAAAAFVHRLLGADVFYETTG